MKEKLISLETAKILNDLNIKFDKNTTVYVMWSKDCDYTTKIPFEPQVFLNGNFYEDFEYNLEEFKKVFETGEKHLEIQFPTHSLLQKYLREAHDMHIGIMNNIGTFHYQIDIRPINKETFDKLQWNHINIGSRITYEDALEFGLQEAIKLIWAEKE